MKKLFILLIMTFFLTACAGLDLMQSTSVEDKTFEELLELAEGAKYDSTMTGAEVQAELDRCAGRNTTVADPGSDAELVTEQAVREALNAKQGTLTNEVGLYSALSDVSDFVQPGENATVLNGTNWRVFYTNDTGDVTELALGADGTYLKSNGTAVAPTFNTPPAGDLLADGTIPLTANWDIGAFKITALTFESDQATGTAPLTVASTTVVTNLNADTVDGESADAFEDADAAIVKSDEAETITSNWDFTANPMADNEMANDPTLDLIRLTPLTSLPTNPNNEDSFFWFDNDTADPADIDGTKNYLGTLSRDTTELMPNQEDRDFTSGTSAWANVDLNAFHETTDLTITANAADQYCTCPVASAPTTVGKRYRMTYDLANIVSTWTLKSFNGTQTIGTISANATQGELDWTATTTGGYRIVANSTTSSGDFDNFTLNELPYIAIIDEDATFFISSIELPSYAHWATGDATYNDTATPHVLTSEEVKGGLITNAGATEDRVYTCPPAEFGINGMGMVIAAYQMDFEPHSGERFTLNGTQMAIDEHIQNTADTKGDVIAFWSVESGDGTYEIFFKSDNANWVEATP